MNRRLLRTLLALTAAIATAPASADILAGKPCETACDLFRTISIFGDAMNGNTEPLSLLGGPVNSGMQEAGDLTYDPGERTLIVSDFQGQEIHVFARDARGDTSPLRAFSNVFLGQPRNVAVVAAHDEYIAINASFIYAFPRSANGVVNALRRTTFDPVLVQNLNGLAYRPASDEIFVGDYYDAGGGQFAGEILVFPRTASGAPVTSRRIAGPATQLGAWIGDIEYDAASDELYVLAVAADGSGSVLTFAGGAQGDVAPLRRIGGPATSLFNAVGLGFNATGNELLVASGSFNAPATHILGFPRQASGNVAPTRDISGPDTGVGGMTGWYDVVAVPLHVLFTDGFE